MDKFGMRRRAAIVVYFVVAVTFLAAVMTGGVAIRESRDFGAQSRVHFVEGLDSDIWLAPTWVEWSIPFVFHYTTASEPFGLRIHILDSRSSFTALNIDELTARYDDGKVSQMRNLTWKFYAIARSKRVGSTVAIADVMEVSQTVKDLVVVHANVEIIIRGHVTNTSGENVSFLVTKSFRAQKVTNIKTWWEVISEI